MPTNYYAARRLLDQCVQDNEDDGVTQRERISRALGTLESAARRLADDLRSYPPPESPGVLFDGYEEWEELAWVPVRMGATPRAAKQIVRRLAGEYLEHGFYLDCEHRCHLAPSEFIHGDDDWRYSPCEPADGGAVEFWQVELVERRFSLRRGIGRLKWGVRSYRNYRRQGEGMWKATLPLRLRFSPLRSLRSRLQRRARRHHA